MKEMNVTVLGCLLCKYYLQIHKFLFYLFFFSYLTYIIIIQEFRTVIKKIVQKNNRYLVNTKLYADDQILMATSEDDLQTMAHNLNFIARKYKMTISSTKTKSMAMWGNHIHRVKIVINDNIIE